MESKEKNKDKDELYPFIFAPIPLWILCRTEISDAAKLVYARLLLYKGKKMYAFPCINTLAIEVQKTSRTLLRLIKELKECRLITVKSGANTGTSNRYFIVKNHPWEIEYDQRAQKTRKPRLKARYFEKRAMETQNVQKMQNTELKSNDLWDNTLEENDALPGQYCLTPPMTAMTPIKDKSFFKRTNREENQCASAPPLGATGRLSEFGNSENNRCFPCSLSDEEDLISDKDDFTFLSGTWDQSTGEESFTVSTLLDDGILNIVEPTEKNTVEEEDGGVTEENEEEEEEDEAGEVKEEGIGVEEAGETGEQEGAKEVEEENSVDEASESDVHMNKNTRFERLSKIASSEGDIASKSKALLLKKREKQLNSARKRDIAIGNLEGRSMSSGRKKILVRLENVWKEEMSRIYSGLTFASWEAKERGQAWMLVQKYNSEIAEMTIKYVIQNWEQIKIRFKGKLSAHPSIGFVLSMHNNFALEAQDLEEYVQAQKAADVYFKEFFKEKGYKTYTLPSELKNRVTKACEKYKSLFGEEAFIAKMREEVKEAREGR
jgi:hypothetical protein